MMGTAIKTELVSIERSTALDAFTADDGLDAVIQQARDVVHSFKHDISTDAGRKKTASLARKVASLKTTLDGMGKELVSGWKQKARAVDINRKKMRDELDTLKIEARAPLTEFEARERHRIEKIKEKIINIDLLGITADQAGNQIPLDKMISNLEALENYVIDDSFDEFKNSAMKVKEDTYAALREAIKREKERSEKDAELERLRQEAEERKKQEYEAGLKRKAAEEARLEAERKAREESARIEYEKQEAVRKQEEAERRAEAAEQRRLADIEQARKEEITRQEQEAETRRLADEKRAADLNHTNNIKTQAMDSLMDLFHIDADFAADIVTAIHEGKIANVMISY